MLYSTFRMYSRINTGAATPCANGWPVLNILLLSHSLVLRLSTDAYELLNVFTIILPLIEIDVSCGRITSYDWRVRTQISYYPNLTRYACCNRGHCVRNSIAVMCSHSEGWRSHNECLQNGPNRWGMRQRETQLWKSWGAESGLWTWSSCRGAEFSTQTALQEVIALEVKQQVQDALPTSHKLLEKALSR